MYVSDSPAGFGIHSGQDGLRDLVRQVRDEI